MILFINGYSFVAFGLLILIVAVSLTWRFVNPLWIIAVAVLTVGALVAFQTSASTKDNTVVTVDQFDTALTAGKPVLLELYSNF